MSNELTTTDSYTAPVPAADVNTINYNPIFPVMTATVKLDLPVATLCEDSLKLAGDQKNYEGGYTTFFNNQNIDHIRGVTELRQAIFGVCSAFGREMKYEANYDKCSIHLWVNVMKKGGYHPPHNHARSVFSGTFYAKVDETTSGLILINPTQPLRNHDPLVRAEDAGPFTSETLLMRPEVNTMIIWPSWLMHSVPQMDSDETRISFSFNVDYLPPGA